MGSMALIDCEECGKEISDQALACPNCGFAHAAVQIHRHQQQQAAMSADYTCMGIIAFAIVAFVVLLIAANT
jgi:uncharacterized membrane protein YvbJ